MKFSELLDKEEIIFAPAAYDVVSAQIIEKAGFPGSLTCPVWVMRPAIRVSRSWACHCCRSCQESRKHSRSVDVCRLRR